MLHLFTLDETLLIAAIRKRDSDVLRGAGFRLTSPDQCHRSTARPTDGLSVNECFAAFANTSYSLRSCETEDKISQLRHA